MSSNWRKNGERIKVIDVWDSIGRTLLALATVLLLMGAVEKVFFPTILLIMIVLGNSLNLLNVDSYWQRIAIGAVTFTGSVVAYLKLSAKIKSAPLMLPGKNVLNLGALVAFAVLTVVFVLSPQMWILGSSNYGAQLAAYFGLPYAFAYFFSGGAGVER